MIQIQPQQEGLLERAAVRLHRPDDDGDGETISLGLPAALLPPVLSPTQMTQLADAIAERLRRVSAGGGQPTDDLRLSQPGVMPTPSLPADGKITVRACFDSDRLRNSSRREPGTWHDYLRTVEGLESAWGGEGPDVRSLTPTALQASFERVSEWKSRETWVKHRKYLIGMLRSACRQTTRNPFGVPKGEAALLNEDDVPVWELPAQKWFNSRGATPTLKLPALTLDEFERLLKACDVVTSDATWWRTLLSFWWFCAMRRTDTLGALTWFNETTRLGIDVTRRWLTWRASKPPHECHDVPLPEWLCVGFRFLRRRTAGGGHPTDLVFARPSGRHNLNRWLYPTLKAICREAGVAYRDPTGFRDSCATHWDEHDPQLTNRFTAHKEQSVVKTHYIVHNESQLRAAADRHPRPEISLDAPCAGVLF